MRSLSPATLKALQLFLDHRAGDHEAVRLLRLVEQAMAPKRSAAPAKKRAAAKKKTRREEWQEIRAAVFERAGGRCECCGRTMPLTADHFFGGHGRRLTLQSIFTVWALCLSCDREKTRNLPSAMAWLARFRIHCFNQRGDGYDTASEIAHRRQDALEMTGRAG